MKKILTAIIALVLGVSIFAQPAFATNSTESFGAVGAAILTDCASKSDDKDGEGIMCILKLVVNIMSVGIGILGVIGISVSGIQYLTAGGNEDQTRKAKRRIFEIVIGLAIYVLIYALLYFLLPGFQGI